MNRILPFAFGMCVQLLSACTTRLPEAAATVPTSSGGDATDQCMTMSDHAPSKDQSGPATNSIQILTIKPPAGSGVDVSTVLVADLEYAVRDFDSGKYIVFAQFETNTNGKSTDGKFNSYPFLKYATGTYRLCFPLIDIWNVPDVKRPLTVRFLLNRVDDARHNHSIAITDRISFPVD
jgi:hypothetical protein